MFSHSTSGQTPKRKGNKSPSSRAKVPRSNARVAQGGGNRGRGKAAQNTSPLYNVETQQQNEISQQERLLNHQKLLNQQQRQRQMLQQQNQFQIRAQQQLHARMLQQQASQQQQLQQQQQPQYIIHPHVTQQAQQQRQCALPSYVPSSQIQEIIGKFVIYVYSFA